MSRRVEWSAHVAVNLRPNCTAEMSGKSLPQRHKTLIFEQNVLYCVKSDENTRLT